MNKKLGDDEKFALMEAIVFHSKTMDIPEMRREPTVDNLRWLNRNIAVRNSKHPDFETVENLLYTLLTNIN